jgi:hypothetical protein
MWVKIYLGLEYLLLPNDRSKASKEKEREKEKKQSNKNKYVLIVLINLKYPVISQNKV